MFARRRWHGLSPYILLLLAFWLLLAIYFLTHPDPISIIALVVTGVAAGLGIWLSRALSRVEQQLSSRAIPTARAAGDEADETHRGASNGRYRPGMNGTLHTQRHDSPESSESSESPESPETPEIPEEGGSNL